MSESLELKAIFDQAKDEFLQSLTGDEQLQFSRRSPAQNLLAEVRKFEVVVKAKQRGLRRAQKTQNLSDNLEPYFKIIEIICGAHPGYANFAWGAFQLILQVHISYPSSQNCTIAKFLLTITLDSLPAIFRLSLISYARTFGRFLWLFPVTKMSSDRCALHPRTLCPTDYEIQC